MDDVTLVWIIGAVIAALLMALLVVGIARKQEKGQNALAVALAAPLPDNKKQRKVAVAILGGIALLVGVIAAISNEDEDEPPTEQASE